MFQSPGAVAIKLGDLTIHWYGILIAVAFLVGLFVCLRVAREKNENPEDFIDLATLILIFAIIGARLYYVIFNWNDYASDLLNIFKIWEGGLAIHGGIIGGLLAGYFYTKYKNLSFAKYCDITCVGLILGQAIGRWGNFFNSEAFGTPTDLPWKLFIPFDKRPPDFSYHEFFHPTFLYESLWDIFVFCILYYILRKRLNELNGALFFCYLGLYSLGRFFIEALRTDSLLFFNTVRAAQLMSLLFMILSGAVLIWMYKHHNNKRIKIADSAD